MTGRIRKRHCVLSAMTLLTLSGCCLCGRPCPLPYALLERDGGHGAPGRVLRQGGELLPANPAEVGETRFPARGPAVPKLSMTVAAPREIQSGSLATFAVDVQNTGEATARGVSITCRFEDGLAFPARPGKMKFQNLGDLTAGESRQVRLTLQSRRPGKFCTEFTLRMRGREQVWKSVCVTVVEKSYDVRLTEPALRTVGDRVEPTIHLANPSSRAMAGVRVVLAFDREKLQPHEATRGVQRRPGELAWDVGALQPGQAVPLQAEFECLAAGNACFSLQVTAKDAPADFRMGCLKIAAASGPFDMRMKDTADLLRPGEQTDVVVGVQNRSGRRTAGKKLLVRVPANFRVVSTSLWRDRRALAVKSAVAGDEVRFDPVPVLGPDDEITYRVRVQALRPGEGRFRATLRPGRAPLLERDEWTTVNP